LTWGTFNKVMFSSGPYLQMQMKASLCFS